MHLDCGLKVLIVMIISKFVMIISKFVNWLIQDNCFGKLQLKVSPLQCQYQELNLG